MTENKTDALAVIEPKEPTLALPDADEWGRIIAIAEHLAQSQFVPVAYRRKPHDIVAATLAGRELGLSPMSAMQRIHVIEGKPTLSAEAMVALVQRSGHEIWTDPGSNDQWAKAYGQRRGSSRVHEMTFTIDEARAAGMTSKNNWKSYPKAMLRARALSALCRIAFADVLAGYVYTPEEMGAVVDEDGEIIEVEIRDGVAQTAAVQQPETPLWITAYVERYGEQAVIEAAEKIRQQLNVGAPITGLGGLAKAKDGTDTARRIMALLERDYDEIAEAEVVTEESLARDWGEQGSEGSASTDPISEPTAEQGTHGADAAAAPATPSSAEGASTRKDEGVSEPKAEAVTAPSAQISEGEGPPASPAEAVTTQSPSEGESQGGDAPVSASSAPDVPALDRSELMAKIDAAVTAKLRVGRSNLTEGRVTSIASGERMKMDPASKPFVDYEDFYTNADAELLAALVGIWRLDELLEGVA